MSLAHADNVQRHPSLPIKVVTVADDSPQGSSQFERALECAARALKAQEQAELEMKFGKARREEDVEYTVFE